MRGSMNKTTQVLLVGALAVGSGGAIAREPATAYQDEIAREAGAPVGEAASDDALHGFVDAAHEVVALRNEYAQRIAQANPADRAVLKWEAYDRMAEAVRAQGLDLAEYQRIGRLLDADDGLTEGLDALAHTPS